MSKDWEKPILNSQYQSRKQLKYISIVVALLPFALFRLFFIVPFAFLLLSVILIGLFLYILKLIFDLHPNHANNPIQILRFNPERIVWIYHQVYRPAPFGFVLLQRNAIVFCTIDGKKHVLNFAENEEMQLVYHQIQANSPHASVGFSLEKEQLFEMHPENLLDYN